MSENERVASINPPRTSRLMVILLIVCVVVIIFLAWKAHQANLVEWARIESERQADSIAVLVAEAQADYDIAFTTYLMQRAWLFSPVDSLGKNTPEKDSLFSVFQDWMDSLKSEIVKAGQIDSTEGL